MTEYNLDVRKLLCPLPVIRVQQKIKSLEKGDILLVIATDPGVLYDIPTWCRLNGHTVVKAETLAGTLQKEIHIEIIK